MFTEREQARAIIEERMREAARDALVRKAKTLETATVDQRDGRPGGRLPQMITRALRAHPAT